ncbi:uncharacterized protein LOC124927293 [Impatiens glandulifera]|uniref:uncharacterized protein LOC124927293 n=1 Tax=Impatiens glandulifera TaxID=253017 RepID=UPI001FB1603B|nr:uncharacterized protein LOC124927293 [Impatiens glandulifera]
MAVQADLIQNQNNLHYDGTLLGGKISISKAEKNIGISRSKNSKALHTSKHSNVSVRKILGDLTNSEKPRSHQASKRAQECKKMDSIIMDDQLQLKSQVPSSEKEGIGGSSKSVSCMESKAVPKPSEKLQTGGRKALGDVTNSQIPSSMEHEGFMHNHGDCIKARKRSEMMNMNYFLETIGQDKSIKLVSPPPLFSFSKSYEYDDDDLSHLKEWKEIPKSPLSRPKSTNYFPDFMDFEEDDEFLDLDWRVASPDFKLKGSP